MGTTIEDASKNAAVNALTTVVGKFFDSRTLLTKKTKISGKILESVKSLSKDIKSYSQGSISYFELLEAEEINGIYRVTARVDVRVEDFKNYIKKYALGEQSIDVGLFANMATDKEQIEEKYALLVDNIIEPMATGQVYEEVELSPPVSFNDWPFKLSRFFSSGSGKSNVEILNRLGISEHDAIVFKMTVRLDKDFKENMLNTLDNIADQKKIIKQNTCKWDYLGCSLKDLFDGPQDEFHKSFKVGVFNKETKATEIYLIKDIVPASLAKRDRSSGSYYDLTKPYAWITASDLCSGYSTNFTSQKLLSHLSVSFLNSSRSVIDTIDVTNDRLFGAITNDSSNSPHWSAANIGFVLTDYRLSGVFDRDGKRGLFRPGITGHLLNKQLPRGGSCHSVNDTFSPSVTVFDELTFWLILKLNQETLKKAKSLVVEFID